MQDSAVLRRALEAAHHLDDESPPWQDMLQGFCDLAGGDSANFIMCDAADQLLLLERCSGDDEAERDYLANWHTQDIMTARSHGAGAGTWLDSQQLFTPASLARNGFYNDFMVAHRMRQIAVFMVESSPTGRAALSIQRSRATDRMRSVVERPPLRALGQALQRGILRRRERAALAMAGLDASVEPFGESAFLVSPFGMVLHASQGATAWLEQRGALACIGSRLQHRDPSTQALWRQALHDAARGGGPLTFVLPAAPGRAHRLELVRAAANFSLRGEPLVLAKLGRDRSSTAAPPHLLRMAFGISPMEAEVLAALAAGMQPKRIAAMHQVSISTVRTQLSSLMGQLGCKRQADLVRRACALL
jgi:DNA-binding CsgD family transcriptional regulator